MTVCWPFIIPPNSGEVPVLEKSIQADYGALNSDVVPDPAAGVGGSRFYNLNNRPGHAVAVLTATGAKVTFNFGGSAFAHSMPSGFSAWGAAATLVVDQGTIALSGGNLTAECTSGSFDASVTSSTSHNTGRWYFEITVVNAVSNFPYIGLWNRVSPITSSYPAALGNSIIVFNETGFGFSEAMITYGLDAGSARNDDNPDWRDKLTGGLIADGDIIGVAVDFDSSRIWFRKNALAWSCLGTTQAFEEFKNWAQLQTYQVVLNIEAGDYRVFSFDANRPFTGISKIIVLGYGATMFSFPGFHFIPGAWAGHWGGGSYPFGIGPTGETLVLRLEDVDPGDTVVVLKSPIRTGSVLEFQVGDWCALSDVELQGHAGYPPNQFNGEFVQIAEISGLNIILTAPVVNGPYKSNRQDRYDTFPTGTTDGYDPGGPASLSLMYKSGRITPRNAWDAVIDVRGMTLDYSNYFPGDTAQVTFAGRDVTLRDVNFVYAQPNPTVSKTWTMIGGTVDGFLEVDKDIEVMTFDGVHFNFHVNIQSASIQQAIFRNCTSALDRGILGTAKHTLIENCNMYVITVGANYGRSKTLTVRNSVIHTGIGAGNSYIEPNASFTYSSGIFNSSPSGFNAVLNKSVPGLCHIGGSGRSFAYAFEVLDISADGSNNLVMTTDIPHATLPTLNVSYATPLICNNPCEEVYVSGCTGSPTAEELCDDYPQGRPLNSYGRRTYTGNFADDLLVTWGVLVEVRVHVITPYAGPLPAANASIGGQYSKPGFHDLTKFVNITINTKIAGERVFTPAGGTGLQSGDSIGLFDAGGFPNADTLADVVWVEGPTCSIDLGGDPGATTPVVTFISKSDVGSQF